MHSMNNKQWRNKQSLHERDKQSLHDRDKQRLHDLSTAIVDYHQDTRTPGHPALKQGWNLANPVFKAGMGELPYSHDQAS